MSITIHLEQIFSQAMIERDQITDKKTLELWHKNFLGKTGHLNNFNRQLKDLSSTDRPIIGSKIQQIKEELDIVYQNLLSTYTTSPNENCTPEFDFSAIPHVSFGSKHPLTIIKKKVIDTFSSAGFKIYSGPDIETEYYNFDALNTAKGHPSRSARDTFYIKNTSTNNKNAANDNKLLLRTHTSAMQARILEQKELPIKAIVYGNTYRRDDDATHTPMFTQLEGFIIQEGLSIQHLKSWILSFITKLLPNVVDIRFRPSFFPFTYCGAEVDIKLKKHGNDTGSWLELLGCGMVHPNILHNAGIDTKKYKGLAFGMGIERLAMLSLNIQDIRQLYKNDTLFLQQ